MPSQLRSLAEQLAADIAAGRLSMATAERRLGRAAFEFFAATAVPVAPTNDDKPRVAALLEHLARLGDPGAWKPAPGYPSVVLALMDSIWSIGVRYSGVVNVIARYTAARLAEGADARADTPDELLGFIARCGSVDAFADAVENHQRTSSRNGILKAEAVQKAAVVLNGHDISAPADLRDLDVDDLSALEKDWRAIEGQGSGLSWDYFLMLSGIEAVKADRHVRRFVAEALGATEAQVSVAQASALVTEASAELGIDRRITDYAIWNEMSRRR